MKIKTSDKYLEAFNERKFDYVATIREQYTDYEYWIKDANWFFNHGLYRDYHPVFNNSYELFWKRNGDNETFEEP